MMLRVQAGARQAPRYLSDILSEQHHPVRADLSANENALGPSLSAIAAFEACAKDLWRYPDGACHVLRTAIGNHYGLDPARITCGAGSDELITLLVRIFAGPGDEVLFPQYSFVMYDINAVRVGAIPVKAPAKELGTDADAILQSITEKTRLIFIANPNNPTGTYIDEKTLRYLADNIPQHIVLVIDSAYAEYVEKPDYQAGTALVNDYPNIIMLRTFSKLFALASLRLGWCYGSPELIDLMERARGPYNVNGPAQAAGAAALSDVLHAEKSRHHNHIWLDKLTHSMRNMGIGVGSSVCNFVLADFQSAANADSAYQFLLQNGILTRPMKGYDLASHLRITVGKAEQNNYLIEVLKNFTM